MKKTLSLLQLFPMHSDLDLRRMHLKLNQYYHASVFGEADAQVFLEKHALEHKQLEQAWITREQNECRQKYPCERIVKNPYLVELALKDHPVVNHPLFDYLCYEANGQQLKNFIRSESILNLEFFDYLAFALIGATEGAKAEIAANLWDEAGRGDRTQFHTRLFTNLTTDLSLNEDRSSLIKDLPWEAIAGLNLFSYCAIYPFNKMVYYGLLAATEMLDPPHYGKLIQGMQRIFQDERIDYSYYSEHQRVDVEHGNGWLRKVILPELEKHPQKTAAFWLGFYLRLDSAKRYYDRLLQQLYAKQAA